MSGEGSVPDEVVLAALETVLKPLGTSMRHYSFEKTRNAAIEAMRQIMLAERERCAATAHDYLINWASDLSDTRDAYIEAQNSGSFNGRRMSRKTAIGLAHTFRERAEAVAGCADDVALAVRGDA